MATIPAVAATTDKPKLRTLSGGERFGIWVGLHGWLLGFVLATMPDTGAFLGPLIGGWMLTVLLAFCFEAVARRTRDFIVIWGSIAVVCGVILVYYSLAIEPEILAHPDVLRRLESLGSVTQLPLWVGAVVGGVGLVVLAGRAMRVGRA